MTVISASKFNNQASRNTLAAQGLLGLAIGKGNLLDKLRNQNKITYKCFSFFLSNNYWFLSIGRNETYLWKGQMTNYALRGNDWAVPVKSFHAGETAVKGNLNDKSQLVIDPTVYNYVVSPDTQTAVIYYLININYFTISNLI